MRNNVVADFAVRAAARADASPPERRVAVYAAAAVATGLIRGDREAAREYAFAAVRENLPSSYTTHVAYAALSITELQAGRPDAAYQWAIEAARVLENMNVDDWERANQRSTEAVWAAIAGREQSHGRQPTKVSASPDESTARRRSSSLCGAPVSPTKPTIPRLRSPHSKNASRSCAPVPTT